MTLKVTDNQYNRLSQRQLSFLSIVRVCHHVLSSTCIRVLCKNALHDLHNCQNSKV